MDPEYPVVKGIEVANRLKILRQLWEKEGLPINEVDLILESDEGEQQIHTYDIGDRLAMDSRLQVKQIKAYLKE